jgi:hypothetical protein
MFLFYLYRWKFNRITAPELQDLVTANILTQDQYNLITSTPKLL